MLDAGPLEETDRWRVLRQILAGLAHIHSQVTRGASSRGLHALDAVPCVSHFTWQAVLGCAGAHLGRAASSAF